MSLVNNLALKTNAVKFSKFRQYKNVFALERNKKYKIHDTDIEYCETDILGTKKQILFLTVELDGNEYSVPLPEKFLDDNREVDHLLLTNKYVKVNWKTNKRKTCSIGNDDIIEKFAESFSLNLKIIQNSIQYDPQISFHDDDD